MLEVSDSRGAPWSHTARAIIQYFSATNSGWNYLHMNNAGVGLVWPHTNLESTSCTALLQRYSRSPTTVRCSHVKCASAAALSTSTSGNCSTNKTLNQHHYRVPLGGLALTDAAEQPHLELHFCHSGLFGNYTAAAFHRTACYCCLDPVTVSWCMDKHRESA